MDMRSSIKMNTVYNMIKTLASIIFPLITFPYISRILQPENVGKVNFGNSIVSYFSLVATLGVTTYAIRECSVVRNDQKKLEQTASEIISINTVTTIISYVALTICLLFVPKLANYRLLITIQSLTIFFTVIGADWLNTSMEDFRYITLRTVIFQLVSLILMFLFVKKPEDYIIYTVISLIASSAGNLCNVFYRRRYGKVRLVRQMNWKKHFPPIMMLFTLLVTQTVLNSMDITMLGFMKGDYEVGIYSTSVKIINIISQVDASMCWVMMPQISKAIKENNSERVNHLLHNASLLTITIGLPCFAGINLLAPEIIEIIGGSGFSSAVEPMRILSLTLLIEYVTGIYGNMYLLSVGDEKTYTIACASALGVNLIANVILIPTFSVNGASVATVFSGIVICVIVLYKTWNKVDIGNLKKMFVAPLLGCGIFYVQGLALKKIFSNFFIRTIVVICSSALLYIGVLILFKHESVAYVVQQIKEKKEIR